jgi:hypothetical protein
MGDDAGVVGAVAMDPVVARGDAGGGGLRRAAQAAALVDLDLDTAWPDDDGDDLRRRH